MNDLFNYSTSLRKSIAEHQSDLSKQAQLDEKSGEFNQKLQEGLTPFTTEFLREGLGPVIKKAGSALSEKLGFNEVSDISDDLVEGGAPKAIRGIINRRFKSNQSSPDDSNVLGEAENNVGREVTFDNPVFDIESAPSSVRGENTYSLSDVLEDKELFNTYAKNNFPELAQNEGETGIENARTQLLNMDNIDKSKSVSLTTDEPVPQPGASSNKIGRLFKQSQEGTEIQDSTEPDITNDIDNTTNNLAEKTSSKIASVGENVGEDVGEGLEDASSILDADVLTAPLGILIGIGSLLGSIFGQKHSQIPIVAPVQASTQFGGF